jgi:hypothetical protein
MTVVKDQVVPWPRYWWKVCGQLHAPVAFTPGTHWIGWVDPRVGLNNVEKRKFLTLPELELRPLGRPARSQSPYRLHYPGSQK